MAVAAKSAASSVWFALPLELWTLVLSHTLRADLLALSLTSRQLHALPVPALLNTVVIWHRTQLLSFLRFIHHSLAARAAHLRALTLTYAAVHQLRAVSEAQLAAVVAGAQDLHTFVLPDAEDVLVAHLALARALAGRASLRALALHLRPTLPPGASLGFMSAPTSASSRAIAPQRHAPQGLLHAHTGALSAHAPPPHGSLGVLRARASGLTRLKLTGAPAAWTWPSALIFPAVYTLELDSCALSMAPLARAFPAVSVVRITRHTLPGGTIADSMVAWPRLRALALDALSTPLLRVAQEYACLRIVPAPPAGDGDVLGPFLTRGLPAAVVLPVSLRQYAQGALAEHWRGRLCALDLDAGLAAPRELCPFVAALVAAGCALQYVHLRATAGADAPWPCDERVNEATQDIARATPALEVLEVSWPVLPSAFGARASEGGHGWLLVRDVESKAAGEVADEVDRQHYPFLDTTARIVLKVMNVEEGQRRRARWFE